MKGAGSGASEPAYGVAPAGFRLPDRTRLGPVRLQVADRERSVEYYQMVLGLRVLRREAGSAALGAHGDDRPLVVLRERSGAAPVPPRGRLGLYHFAVLLPARAELGRLLRHLAEAGVRPGAADHHVSEALYLSDPDGLGIEVYADRPRAQWQTRGRELRIGTAPLNAPALLEAAQDTRWRGMPAGASIGHVHLQVGGLQAAAAFYHGALGLDRITWSYPGALFLGAGGYHHHLGLNTWAADAAPAGEQDARLLEWTMELPDADSVAGAERSLAEAGYPAERSGDAVVTRDPWGTRLRIRVAAHAREAGGTRP